MNTLELVITIYRQQHCSNEMLTNEEIVEQIDYYYPSLIETCCGDILSTPEITEYRIKYNYTHLDNWFTNRDIYQNIQLEAATTKLVVDNEKDDEKGSDSDKSLIIKAYRKDKKFKDSYYTDKEILYMIKLDKFKLVPFKKFSKIVDKATNKNTKNTNQTIEKKKPNQKPLENKCSKMCIYQTKCTKKDCKFAHTLLELEPLKCFRDLECPNQVCLKIHSNENIASYFIRIVPAKRTENSKSKMCLQKNCIKKDCLYAHRIEELRPLECGHGKRCLKQTSICMYVHPGEQLEDYVCRLNIKI